MGQTVFFRVYMSHRDPVIHIHVPWKKRHGSYCHIPIAHYLYLMYISMVIIEKVQDASFVLKGHKMCFFNQSAIE